MKKEMNINELKFRVNNNHILLSIIDYECRENRDDMFDALVYSAPYLFKDED